MTQLTKALAEAELVAKHVGRDSPVGKEAGQRPGGGPRGRPDRPRAGPQVLHRALCALAMAPPTSTTSRRRRKRTTMTTTTTTEIC